MTGVLQEENKSLKSQLRQLQNEYQAEQGKNTAELYNAD